MLKCLVSGACGYLGSMLVPELAKHYEVVAIDSLLYGPQHTPPLLNINCLDNVKFYHAKLQDFTEYPEWLECDCYILLSALVGGSICEKNPTRAWTSNYYSIKGFLEQLPQDKRVIYPATTSNYGSSNEEYCNEDSISKPLSLYAETKWEAEKLVSSRENHTVLRLGTVYGSSLRNRFDLLVNDMTAQSYFNGQIDLFQGNYKRAYLHIKDAVRAIIWSLSPSIQGTYNVVSDNLTKNELVKQIGLQKECIINKANGEDPDRRNYFVDSSRIKSQGFQFKHSVNDGIRNILNFCKCFSYNQIMEMRNV